MHIQTVMLINMCNNLKKVINFSNLMLRLNFEKKAWWPAQFLVDLKQIINFIRPNSVLHTKVT